MRVWLWPEHSSDEKLSFRPQTLQITHERNTSSLAQTKRFIFVEQLWRLFYCLFEILIVRRSAPSWANSNVLDLDLNTIMVTLAEYGTSVVNISWRFFTANSVDNVGGNLSENLISILGRITFPADTATGNPLCPITVRDGLQFRFKRHSSGFLFNGSTLSRNGNYS